MATAPPTTVPHTPGLYIYEAPAVNTYKLSILCEELGVSYNYIPSIDSRDEQNSEWSRNVSPSDRTPVIVHVKKDGTYVALWESASCMLYIASRFDEHCKISYQHPTQEYWDMIAWLSWQVSGQGSMTGHYSSESAPNGMTSYIAERRRLFHFLDNRLCVSPYVVGSILSVADIAIFAWVFTTEWRGVEIEEFPSVKAWHDKIYQRPAIQRGLKIPRRD